MLLIGQERRTNTPLTTLFAAIAAVAILLMPALAMSQGHGAGGGGGGSGGPGGAGAGGHTSHDDGHSGGKGGSDPTRGKGRAPSSLGDVFRGMEDEAGSKGRGKADSSKGSAPTVTKKAPPAKGPSVSKKGPPEGKGPSAKSQDVVTEDTDGDDDSDRPDWAGGNPDLNPHSGGGGGKPVAAGTKKGDLYGDLIMLVRNPETGEAVTNEDGEYLICQDAACNPAEAVATVDGEVPDGVTAIEVDFGRAAVARAPSKVVEKALTDALAKLTVDGVVLGTDTAGRITYTISDITNTIDSPLENLALYIDLLKGLADDNIATQTEDALGSLATLDTAAALFAGVADKTGDITIDYVYYQNLITGNADPDADDTFYDYSDFSYTRDYPDAYSYWYSDDGADPISLTLDINTYLDTVNGTLPTGSAALFAAAADDSLEVIELVHTQVYTEVLPGTTDAPSN